MFLRCDGGIAEEVRREIVPYVFPEPGSAGDVPVREGVVGLAGRVRDTAVIPVARRGRRGPGGGPVRARLKCEWGRSALVRPAPASDDRQHEHSVVRRPGGTGERGIVMTETGPFTEQDPIRAFLLDDHEVVRRGITGLLDAEPDVSVVGDADTVEHALSRGPALRPHVAVLDVRLPDGDGITVCRELRGLMPEPACLMLSSFDDEDSLLDAVMAGASGRPETDQGLRPGPGRPYGHLGPVHAGPGDHGPPDALTARRPRRDTDRRTRAGRPVAARARHPHPDRRRVQAAVLASHPQRPDSGDRTNTR